MFDMSKEKSTDPGIQFGVIGNSEIYADNVVLGAERGHGFAAEKANHLYDLFSGKDAKIIGGDNVKNGADRLVNGVQLQTKYCASGSKCIAECFENGKIKYFNSDGSPMIIEVPSDKYNSAVQAMENRIKTGQVPGVTDPAVAKEIVKEGAFTYAQARNIAKFGTIESITYDAVNGISIAGTSMGISAAITFAYSVWNGKDYESALQSACISGLNVGGVTWVSGVLSSQIGRTGIEKSLRPLTDYVVQKMGPKAAAWIANGLRGSSSSIYGAAAMNNVSKILRGNIVTGAITTLVLSAADITRLVRGHISGSQAFKNITTTAVSVAAGTGGWLGGAAIGTAILPGIGTVVGGILGGVLAGMAGAQASKTVLDYFIEDDAKEMLRIFEEVFIIQAQDFLLSELEIESVSKSFEGIDMPSVLREMYASEDRNKFAEDLFLSKIIEIVQRRAVIRLPSDEELLREVGIIIEQVV